MTNTINFINNILKTLEKWLVVLSFSLMLAFSFLNVVLRALYIKFDLHIANEVLNRIDWSEPFARLMVLWITFLGASLLTMDNRHIRIDVMGQFLSPYLLKIREIILSVACSVVCFFMLLASIGYINLEMKYGTSSIMGVDAWKWQLIIPFGFSMMLLRFLVNLLNEITDLFGENTK